MLMFRKGKLDENRRMIDQNSTIETEFVKIVPKINQNEAN